MEIKEGVKVLRLDLLQLTNKILFLVKGWRESECMNYYRN